MKSPPLDVLYEDNHLLVVNKPAGLPTMGTPSDQATLLTVAKEYIKHKYSKPGNVYLGIVSRLDVPVSGVVVLARTSKAANRLTEQFRDREVDKTYWVLVEGVVETEAGRLADFVRHDERHRRVHTTIAAAEGAKEASLTYRRLALIGGYSLLEIRLETGRKHQIRVQWASRKHPVIGDRKYGSKRVFASGIALHARHLAISHPVGGQRLEFVAPLPGAWQPYREALERLV